MKYVVKKRNVVTQMVAWIGIVFFGLMNLCIVWGCWMDPTLATGPVIAMFFLWWIVIIFNIFYLQYATLPKIIVKGDELVVHEFLKRKRTIFLRRINGRFVVPYTEESSEKQLRNAFRDVPGGKLIAKLIASTEKWKNESMVKITYFSNGEDVLTIHTGMKNGIRLDKQIVDSLEINWGYIFDGSSTMGVVPVKERVQVSAANLRHFTNEKDAEQYLKQMVVVEGPTKVVTMIFLIGFLLFLVDVLKIHIVSREITLPMLTFFGIFTLIFACAWLIAIYSKKKSIRVLKNRQELILAADQLYGLGGLGRKENKLKITPDFIFSNFATAIIPLDEILWLYTKNTENSNEICVGTVDGRILSIGRYNAESAAQQAFTYNLLSDYLADANIIRGFSPRNQAIYDKLTGRNK